MYTNPHTYIPPQSWASSQPQRATQCRDRKSTTSDCSRRRISIRAIKQRKASLLMGAGHDLAQICLLVAIETVKFCTTKSTTRIEGEQVSFLSRKKNTAARRRHESHTLRPPFPIKHINVQTVHECWGARSSPNRHSYSTPTLRWGMGAWDCTLCTLCPCSISIRM